MIKQKIKTEMLLQKISQKKLVETVNKLDSSNKLTQSQLSKYLSGESKSIKYLDSIFEVLEIKLIKIL